MPIKEDRVINVASDDRVLDNALRPRTLNEYVGQENIRRQLKIYIQAAKQRAEPLDHILFFGPPGLGKTTLARLIAYETKSNIVTSSGPVLERGRDIAALLSNLERRDILFIDEAHRLPPVVEEILYPAMEDYQIDIMLGEGAAARSLSLAVAPFTLIGATARSGLLTSPLRARFGISLRLDFYTPEELARIVKRSAGILDIKIDDAGALELAKRARGTPRLANRLLRRVRDYAQVEKPQNARIDQETTAAALKMLRIDNMGLDEIDRLFLKLIIEKFSGGPVGIENLASAMHEMRDTLEDVVEPFLIQQGLVKRTQRGRMATDIAYRHFSLEPPHRTGQTGLFNSG